MGLRSSSVLCLALFLAFSSSINGLDITKILGQYPQFESFNKYLTETNLANDINSLKSVTILALDNSALAGKSPDAVKAFIGTHVVADFYDEKKLMEAQGSHTPLLTLSSGSTKEIYVALVNEGEIAFGGQGSNMDTKLVTTVTTQPDTVSILQVTQPIVVPGAAQASKTSSSPSSSGSAKAPATSASVAETPDSSVAGAPAPSSSSRIQMGFLGAVMAFASIFVSL